MFQIKIMWERLLIVLNYFTIKLNTFINIFCIFIACNIVYFLCTVRVFLQFSRHSKNKNNLQTIPCKITCS